MATAGDVLAGLDMLFRLVRKLSCASGDLKGFKAEMTRMQRKVEKLEPRLRSLPPEYSADATEEIEVELNKIHREMPKAKKILEERQEIPRHELASLFFWILFRLPKLERIAEEFHMSQRNIADAITTYPLYNEGQRRTASSTSSSDDEIEPRALVTPKRSPYMPSGRNFDVQGWVTNNSSTILAAAQNPSSQSRQTLLNGIVQAGYDVQVAGKRLDSLLGAVRGQHASQEASTMEEKSQARQRSLRGPEHCPQPPIPLALPPKPPISPRIPSGPTGFHLPRHQYKNKITNIICITPPPSGPYHFTWTLSPSPRPQQNAEGQRPVFVSLPISSDTPQKPAHEVQSNVAAPTPCRFHLPGPFNPPNQAHLAATTPRLNTEHVWILIVDSVNGARSISAQYYFEVLRRLIMNSQKRWLFAHVDSASYQELPVLGSKPSPEVMTAAAREVNTAGDTRRNELIDPIHNRIANRVTRAVSDADFLRYHYMICFDNLDKLTLTARKEEYSTELKTKEHLSTIHYLAGCEKYSDTFSKSEAPWDRLSHEMDFILTEWVFSVLSLRRPCTVLSVKWQTVEVEGSITEEQIVGWERSWKDHGCEAHSVGFQDKSLLSVSGPPDKVTLAAVRIRLLFFNKPERAV